MELHTFLSTTDICSWCNIKKHHQWNYTLVSDWFTSYCSHGISIGPFTCPLVNQFKMWILILIFYITITFQYIYIHIYILRLWPSPWTWLKAFIAFIIPKYKLEWNLTSLPWSLLSGATWWCFLLSVFFGCCISQWLNVLIRNTSAWLLICRENGSVCPSDCVSRGVVPCTGEGGL